MDVLKLRIIPIIRDQGRSPYNERRRSDSLVFHSGLFIQGWVARNEGPQWLYTLLGHCLVVAFNTYDWIVLFIRAKRVCWTTQTGQRKQCTRQTD